MGIFEQNFKMAIENNIRFSGKKVDNPKIPMTLHPLAIEQRYAVQIRKIVIKPVTDFYKNRIIPNITRWVEEEKVRFDEFETEFEALQNELQDLQDNIIPADPENSDFRLELLAIATLLLAFNRKQWQKQTAKVTGLPYVAPENFWPPIRDQWVRENYNLVRNISNLQISQLNEIVYRGIRNSSFTKDITKDIKKVNDNIKDNRANLIARDQSGKLSSRISKNRQVDVGVDFYIWQTAMDEDVRPSHEPLNGKLCSWKDSTIYAEVPLKGEKPVWKKRPKSWTQVPPEEDMNCRCTPTPYFADILEEVNNDLAA